MGILGLDRNNGRPETFISGYGQVSGMVYYFDLEVELPDNGITFKSCIGFSEQKRGYGVLGFYGFLDRFDASFREDYFELIPRSAAVSPDTAIDAAD